MYLHNVSINEIVREDGEVFYVTGHSMCAINRTRKDLSGEIKGVVTIGLYRPVQFRW